MYVACTSAFDWTLVCNPLPTDIDGASDENSTFHHCSPVDFVNTHLFHDEYNTVAALKVWLLTLSSQSLIIP
jgi:hypothetical protein